MGSRLATLYRVYSEQGCLMVALVSLKCRSVSYIQKIKLMMTGVEYKRSCQEYAWKCILDAQRVGGGEVTGQGGHPLIE